MIWPIIQYSLFYFFHRSSFPIQPATSTPRKSRSGVITTPKSSLIPIKQGSESADHHSSVRKTKH